MDEIFEKLDELRKWEGLWGFL